MISKKTIEEAKNRLVKAYSPLAIYLFGSYAWGHPDEDSDLDLCIIVDRLDIENRHKLLVEGYRALFDLGIAKDLLLYTEQEFEAASANKTTLCYKIKQKGRVIYASA